MEIIEEQIPNIDQFVDYITYWKTIYNKLYNDKTLKVKDIHVIEKHLARNFNKTRFHMDEDLFEWNHAMIVTIVLAVAYDRSSFKEISDPFLRNNALFNPKESGSFANALLDLTIVQTRWEELELDDLLNIKAYLHNVHKSVLRYFIFADNLKVMNRWNLMKKVGKDLYQPNCTALMLVTCRIAMQRNNILCGTTVKPYLCHENKYTFSNETMKNFFLWAKNEKTYFSIRNFRNRILNMFWMFMNDEATRCLYTYKRTGEIPSIHSHVTGKYPQKWTSSMQHFILYGESHELITHRNRKIAEATLLALWEAHLKTIYGFKFTQFCVCLGDNIIDQIQYVLASPHPVLLYIWNKWYLSFNSKIYKYTNLQETLLAWLHYIHEECDSTLLKQISLLKLCLQLCVKEIPVEKDYSKESFIEVSI